MTASRRAVAFVGCAIAAIVVLEGLRWLRPVALACARSSAARVHLAGGRAVLSKEFRVPGASGWESELRWYSVSGDPEPPPAGADEASPPVSDGGFRGDSSVFAAWEARVEPRKAASATPEGVAAQLDFAQGWGQGHASALEAARTWLRANAYADPLCAWTYERGRFVCRDVRDGSVKAGVGPDGWTEGALGTEGESFAPSTYAPAPARTWGADGGSFSAPLLEPQKRRIHFLRAVNRYGTKDALAAPMRVHVSTVTVEPIGGPELRAASDDRSAWLWWSLTRHDPDAMAVLLRSGDELVAVRPAGVAWRVALGPEERDAILAHEGSHVGSVLAPVGGPVARLRVRRILDDGRAVSADADALPVTTAGRVSASLVGVVAALRPPLLAAASFAAPPAADYADYHARWFRDGVIAGGAGTPWLALSVAIGAGCAIWARRQARLRAPGRVAQWTALGLAAGVLVLPWMRLAMPRSHVAACACGRRRAVHVALCPSCAAAWPAPAPTGLEVFA